MTAHTILSSMILAAPEDLDAPVVQDSPVSQEGPNVQDAIATAFDWHLGGGGLYSFASQGGVVSDSAVQQTALQEVEDAMAYVRSHADDINSGTMGEFEADSEEATGKGMSTSDYVMSRLENLKAALQEARQPDPDESGTEAPVPVPEAVNDGAPVTGSVEKESRTLVSVDVFNKARQAAQQMALAAEGQNEQAATELRKLLEDLNQIEIEAAGELQKALDDKVSPQTAERAKALIQKVVEMQRQGATQAPQEGQPVEASAAVVADFADETIRSLVQFVRVNRSRLRAMFGKPGGDAKVQEVLSTRPGGQMAGPVTPYVRQLAEGAMDENTFIASITRFFRRNVQASCEDCIKEAGLAGEGFRTKTASDGSIHMVGVKKGASTLRVVQKFAFENKVAVHIVRAFEEDTEDATCPECGGAGVPMGSMGSRAHYRCRNCGMGFSHEVTPGHVEASTTQAPDTARSGELPYDEGGAPARKDEQVYEDLHTAAAGPEPEDRVIKVGDQYLVIGDDTTSPETGGVSLTLSSSQKAATRLGASLAHLWMDDERLSRLIAEQADGASARIVRVVSKQAKVAAPPPPPSAAGNHAGPANPVNPTGQPAPGTPPPAPAPAAPSTQGPSVNHINPGGAPNPTAPAPPAPAQAPVPPGQQAQQPPPQQVQGSATKEASREWHKSGEVMARAGRPGTVVVSMPEVSKGPIISLQATSDLCKVLPLAAKDTWEEMGSPNSLERRPPTREEMDAFEQDMLPRRSRPTLSSLHTASEGTLNGILAEIEGTVSQLQELADSAVAKARLLNDESLVAAVERMNTAVFEAGMAARHSKGLASGVKGKDESQDDDDQKPGELKEASAKKDCDCGVCSYCNGQEKKASHDCTCGGDCECKGTGDCRKEASAKTADNAEVAAVARETVLDWMAEHPTAAPDWADFFFAQAHDENKAEVPDFNEFIRACQHAYAEMSKSLNKKEAQLVAALSVKARGLMGPTADEGDSVENAVKFIHGNSKDIEDETVAGLRQLLGEAGYDRMVIEVAIEEVFGDEATLANGATLKTLLKKEG